MICMVDKAKVTKDIVKYMVEVLEVPRDEFSGFAVCPFAKAERTSNRLMVDVFDPGQDDFVEKVKSMEQQGYSSGIFAVFQDDIPVEISSEDTKKFQIFINKTMRLAGLKRYKNICFNPNDTASVDGFCPRSLAPYFLVNVAKREDLAKANKNLRKTSYYDKLNKEYKKFLSLN